MPSLRLLFVDDVDENRTLVCDELTRSGYVVESERVSTASPMRAALARQPWDAIISEYSLARFDAAAALSVLQESGVDIPFIIFSDGAAEPGAIAALAAGAHAYLRKDRIALMSAIIARELRAAGGRREHAERAATLQESEKRYRLLLDSTAEGIYAIDLDGACTWCNSACLRMLGYAKSADLVGRSAHALFHHTRADGTSSRPEECRIYQTYRDGEGCHLADAVFWRSDGTSFPAEVWSHPIWRESRVIGAVVTFVDITERRAAAAALGDSERRFRATFEHAGIGMAIVDPGGRLVRVNAALRRMLGYTDDELATMTLEALTDPDDVDLYLQSFRELVAGTRDGLQVVKRCIGRDGRKLWGRITMSLVRDGAGQPQYAIGMLEDITESRRLEEEFRQAQKMEAVGRLAGGIAHDFNNLLTSIIGFSELLLTDADLPPSLRHDVEEIRNAGKSAASLTGQLLAFGRKQVLQPQNLDLNVVVTRIESLLRRTIGENVSLVTDLAPALDHVNADPGQIEQVIINLVLNARDALSGMSVVSGESGGTLTIATSNARIDPARTDRYHGTAAGAYVRLAVSDTGTGMEPAVQAHLFEPFFSTKERGSGAGLGLATVYGIVKQSGGLISVDSQVGRGTTIEVLLPVAQLETAPAPAPRRQTAWPRGSETILLVEDQAEVRAVTRIMLARHGYHVLEAEHGQSALAISGARDLSIDLLLTDVVMPGINGFDLAKRIIEGRPELRVLYASGYTDEAMLDRGVLEPGVFFIQKPYTPEGLLRKLREVLDAPGVAAPRA